MVAAKTELFEEDLQQRANLFKALSHPARLQILQYLIQSKTCLSGDISEMFPLTRTSVNQHMKELKEAGLIKSHVEGCKIIYCLDCGKIKEMSTILAGFQNEIRISQDFCCNSKSTNPTK